MIEINYSSACSNHSETLPIESNTNITCIALSPDGVTLILVNEGKTISQS